MRVIPYLKEPDGLTESSEWQGKGGIGYVANHLWDTDSLSWVKATSSTSGSGTEVVVTASALPSGASTAANQTTANTSLAAIEDAQEPKAKQIDEASATVTYIGWADPGSSVASAIWRIQKITVSGSTTGMTWADGNASYDNVWDNRASLSYS